MCIMCKEMLKKRSGIKLNLDMVVCKNIAINNEIIKEKVSMNGVGSRIYEIITNPIRVNEIVSILINEYDVNRKVCEETVIDFLGKLNHAGIITIK